MKYRNYNVQVTPKLITKNNLEYNKMVVELKSNKDYIFYLVSDLSMIDIFDIDKKDYFKILVKQLKLIVDKRIIEKTIFNSK
jgi:hypothetical protein|tara:strand:- start:668 stop:913 length:246 start_codon:yes stop_codon:yes gene_type:complete